MLQKLLVNNQIRAREVRVIDENGRQIGILPLEKALQLAKEKGLDLIQVTEKVEPPVCKLADYGKYLYWIQKKGRQQKSKSEVKVIRLGFNISLHDLETRVNQAEKFLKQGNKVKIEMLLRGRERGLEEIGKEKFNKFLELLKERVPIKIERELKKEPKGFSMIIVKV